MIVRRRWVKVALALVALGVALTAAWTYSFGPDLRANPSTITSPPPAPVSTEPIVPIPQTIEVDARKAQLGNRLFHDPRLSRNNSLACASCHLLNKGGADGMQHSVGITGRKLAVNTPTVFNSGFNFRQFWDGRAATLDDQIDGPLQHNEEMGATWPRVIGMLKDDALYKTAFSAIYADGVQVKNVKDAIATFERALITPNSRFDKYLRGDRNAITAAEQAGYRLFKNYGCIACHQGINIGGNMYQRLGIMADYFRDRGKVTNADLGRYNVTGREEDKHIFKVPGLRNVALTAPYFHDGSAATLVQAVAIMGKYQLGVDIPSTDIALLVAFLGTLTGEQNTEPQ